MPVALEVTDGGLVVVVFPGVDGSVGGDGEVDGLCTVLLTGGAEGGGEMAGDGGGAATVG